MKKQIAWILSFLMLAQMAVPNDVIAAPETAQVLSPENSVYEIPISPNVDYNMNLDWKFAIPEEKAWPLKDARESMKVDGKEFFEVGYDDSMWESVSVPHSFNGNELFDNLASGQGDAQLTRCITFYRKHFSVDPEHAGKKMLLEFEGVRQAAYLWVNGQFAGYYEAGVNAFGFDITRFVKTDGSDNVIAVALDNTTGRGMSEYMSETKPGSEPGSSDGTGYEWNSNEFNPTVGGLTRDVILHVKSDVYQTLPLYNNLKTTGTYVYGQDIDPKNQTATISVESEVRNESASAETLSLEVAVVDQEGNLWYRFEAEQPVVVEVASDKGVTFERMVPDDAYDASPMPTDTSTVEVKKIIASAKVEDIHLWSTKDPFLYDVYSILKDGEEVLDVTKTTTGFRKVEAKGGTDGGIFINDERVWLTGYAQRATNEWATVGAVPAWLHDYDMSLVRESNANFIRWMHIAAQPSDIRACDKYGIACAQPAGDKEKDAQGRQWDQRVEVMRDTIIYFRNNPSILFWEAGNQAITAEHMREMTALRKKLDPYGYRSMGCRALGADQDAVDASEYVGTMLGRQVENDSGFTANGPVTRDKRAIVESEYFREEAPRRVWDDYSAPWYDYIHNSGGEEGDTWDLTAEDMVVQGVKAYGDYYLNRVGSASSRPIYSAAAALCWTDSVQHGRNTATENARMSGRVDPLRTKKQSFYAFQTMQSTEPSMYLAGHWNYSSDLSDYKNGVDPTQKTVYVLASHCRYVELFVNGELVGRNTTPDYEFLYPFYNVDVTQNGYVEAIGYDKNGKELVRQKVETTGEAAELRLIPVTGEQGLLADGSDLAYFDLEVVDEEGRVVPLDYSEINLELTGDAQLCGSYNSGYSVDYGDGIVNVGKMNADPNVLRAECGTNRIMIKAGRTAGDITLTARRDGLDEVSVTVTSIPVETEGGLTTDMPQRLTADIEVPEEPEEETPMMLPLIDPVIADFSENGNVEIVGEEEVQKKEIAVYIDDKAVDFGKGDSGKELVAYEMAQSVYAPVEAFAEALGAECKYEKHGADYYIEFVYDGKTVILESSLLTKPDGNTTIINQIADLDDGVLHAEISAITDALGFETNGWSSGDTEYRIKTK